MKRFGAVSCVASLAVAAPLAAATISFQAGNVYPIGDTWGSGAAVAGDFDRDAQSDLATIAWSDAGTNVVLMRGLGDGRLVPASSFPVADTRGSLVAADFNGDSNLDLAVTEPVLNRVTVALGHGDGTFTVTATVTVGTSPQGLVVGDWNGDGKPDLATTNVPPANVAGSVTVLLGVGNGTFTARADYPVGIGAGSIVTIDLNVDGRPDLVVANRRSRTLSVLLAQPGGVFAAAPDVAVGPEPLSLVAADFDRDSKGDLAVSDGGTGGVAVLLGNGNGTFQSTNVSYGWGVLLATDVNADGIVDLCVGSSNENDLRILLGLGDGHFALKEKYTTPMPLGAIVAADLNGDGHPDLALPNDGVIGVFAGRGDGTFDAARSLFSGLNQPRQVLTADLNKDGLPDLVVIGGASRVAIHLGTGAGTFAPPTAYPYAGSSAGRGVVGDFNRDGNLDVAVSSVGVSSSIGVLLGTGTGTLLPAVDYPANGDSLLAVDLDMDGKLDLVGSAEGRATVLLRGNGDGTFQDAVGILRGNRYVVTADFNTDGKPDLLVGTDNVQQFLVFLGNGDGAFLYRSLIPGGRYLRPTVADFNGDGVPDLALSHEADDGGLTPNKLWIVLGNGDGTFRGSLMSDIGLRFGEPAAADFDGDGHVDLAVGVGNPSAGDLRVFRGNGDGTLQPPISFAAAFPGGSVADFDGDGKPDLVGPLGNYAVSLIRNTSP